MAHRQGNPLFGLFPGEDADFGFRREHRALHGNGVWMTRFIIRQDQDRVLATTHEIQRHGEDEVGVDAEQVPKQDWQRNRHLAVHNPLQPIFQENNEPPRVLRHSYPYVGEHRAS